ncbi:hypothetical protein [Mycolicibacterium sp. HK-90]|nr:hypothetical protein [Mycolicibacterium sp. HK-90]WKG06222.1 hypothetical protein QU592_14580 [Mycolicibacterium sp. HK-90]
MGIGFDRAAARAVRVDASFAPSLLSSIWNRARLAPLKRISG